LLVAGQQVLKGTSITVTETFSVDGTPTDLDSGVPTVVAKFPDGSALTPAPVASGSWTGRTTGQYRIVLDGQAEVTYLDPITWTGAIGGKTEVLYSRVEWIGGLLFALSDLRGLRVGDEYPFATTATPAFTNQQLMDARAATLDEFEHFLGYSPVPRHARAVLDGDGSATLLVPHLKAHRLLAVSVNGTAQSLASYTLRPSGVLEATSSYTPSGSFTAGRQNVAVEYVHGEQRVMGDGGLAAMLRVTQRLLPGFSSAARSVTTPDGVTYDLGDMAGQVTRGGTTRRFGIPAIDSWLQEWQQSGLAVA
jgi:hypothetical protein